MNDFVETWICQNCGEQGEIGTSRKAWKAQKMKCVFCKTGTMIVKKQGKVYRDLKEENAELRSLLERDE